MRRSAIEVGVSAVTVLATSGGSGRGHPGCIRDHTGLAPPTETPAEQLERALDLRVRSDPLLLSTLYAETDLPEAPAFRLLTACSGTQCTLTHFVTSASKSFALSNQEAVKLSVWPSAPNTASLSCERRDAIWTSDRTITAEGSNHRTIEAGCSERPGTAGASRPRSAATRG